ncbi:MAG: excinuclease ABC subunit UvrA [Planctomycetota bacterium]
MPKHPPELEPISVRGAATHNLQRVDLDLPRNRLIVFCGVSGSGKTSMAIDTLYAEGQRRYIESFSTYTRQFLEQLDKPAVDRIDGLPPAVAVTQGGGAKSNRATLATATEIADHLRLLYARAGQVVCPQCHEPVRSDTVEGVVEALTALGDGARAMLGFTPDDPADEPATWLAEQAAAGYVRAVVGEQTVSIDSATNAPPSTEPPVVLVDRVAVGSTTVERLTESVEAALDAGGGVCEVLASAEADGDRTIDGRPWRTLRFSRRLRCEPCGRDFEKPTPQLLNFNNPLGACPECEGFGSVVETDMRLVVPDPSKSLREGAVAPWNTPAYKHELEELLALAPDFELPVDVPYDELTEDQRRLVIEGVPERDFGGLSGFFQWLERRKYKMHLRVFLSRWRSYLPCPVCHGDRLRPSGLAVRVGGKNLAEFCRQNASEAIALLDSLDLAGVDQQIAAAVDGQVRQRLEYLRQVGLGYLTLDRPVRTLSTGEARRAAMTTTLGSTLVDMLYVLDEPSAGLHPADVRPLVGALERVRDRGNTVVVVEHEEAVVKAADQVVEFGPEAGVEGGNVVFEGSPAELATVGGRTGDWLAGRRTLATQRRREPGEASLRLLGASGHNLKQLDAEFPLGVLCVVTGVSGAGKSSLVLETLLPAVQHELHSGAAGNGKSNGKASGEGDSGDTATVLPFRALQGAHHLDGVLQVDGKPVSRSPRSGPVTYIKAFDLIRGVFAEQPDAAARGFTASHFSFNVDGGRCDSCQGAGYHEVDMQFLADVRMRCGECNGRRYRNEVLDIKYRGRDIAEVLDMTALQAFRFFRGENKVQSRLKVLLDVGLGYLRLGQPATTLSGGEAQRLKLAGRLAAKQSGATLFVLDEPTTGLHYSDVAQLIDCFDALVDVGHSLIVVDHNVQMMLAADWIIDLGPGPAAEGGMIVAQGPPETVAKNEASATGRVLAEALARDAELLATLDDGDE